MGKPHRVVALSFSLTQRQYHSRVADVFRTSSSHRAHAKSNQCTCLSIVHPTCTSFPERTCISLIRFFLASLQYLCLSIYANRDYHPLLRLPVTGDRDRVYTVQEGQRPIMLNFYKSACDCNTVRQDGSGSCIFLTYTEGNVNPWVTRRIFVRNSHTQQTTRPIVGMHKSFTFPASMFRSMGRRLCLDISD